MQISPTYNKNTSLAGLEPTTFELEVLEVQCANPLCHRDQPFTWGPTYVLLMHTIISIIKFSGLEISDDGLGFLKL